MVHWLRDFLLGLGLGFGAPLLFGCNWTTTQDGHGNGTSHIGPSDSPTGIGSASLVCTEGDGGYPPSIPADTPVQRSFASIATCERHPDETLLVHVGSDTCDDVTFSVPAYNGPGTYQGDVDIYIVEPDAGCMGAVGTASTFATLDAGTCGAMPPHCTIGITGSASFTSKGTLSLDAKCPSFSYDYGYTCGGKCSESNDVTVTIQDCDLRSFVDAG
jgi:hypothetical protein